MKRYFKKFSIMFVILLTIIGVGVIQNGTTANAATVGQQLTAPEDGWRRYDSTDKNIIYSSNFSLYSEGNSYNGNLEITKSGGSIHFKFVGTKLRIIAFKNSDKSNNHTISIDNNTPVTFSTYNGSYQGQMIVYEILNLQNGIHNVVIDAKAVMSLDAIDINKDGQLLPGNESISINESSLNLNVGDSQQLTATTTPSSVAVTWSSSDTSVATVDSNGKVTAVGSGTAIITATTTDGSNLSASCTVNVIAKGTEPDPTDSDKIVNIAHAKGDNTNNAGGDVTIIFHGTADTTLSVVKTADVKDVWVGDNFTYTIVVTNTGTKTAKAVVVNDPVPNHINFNVNGVTTTQGSVDSSSTSKNIIVNVGDIAPGATVTIKVPATVIA